MGPRGFTICLWEVCDAGWGESLTEVIADLRPEGGSHPGQTSGESVSGRENSKLKAPRLASLGRNSERGDEAREQGTRADGVETWL